MKGCLNKIFTGNCLACLKTFTYGCFDYKRSLIPAIFVYNNTPNIKVTIGELYQPAAALQSPRYKCPILCPPRPEPRGHSLQTLDPGRGWLNLDTSKSQGWCVALHFLHVQVLTMIKILRCGYAWEVFLTPTSSWEIRRGSSLMLQIRQIN